MTAVATPNQSPMVAPSTMLVVLPIRVGRVPGWARLKMVNWAPERAANAATNDFANALEMASAAVSV